MSAEITLYGARYSVYVRAVLMALESKGVSYDIVPIDIFSGAEDLAADREIHPFGRIPALRDGDFILYETAAINRYIDEGFLGPRLQPAETQSRARMTQIMNLTSLAPDIQEDLLYLSRVKHGRDPVTERDLRAIAAMKDWEKQRRMWRTTRELAPS